MKMNNLRLKNSLTRKACLIVVIVSMLFITEYSCAANTLTFWGRQSKQAVEAIKNSRTLYPMLKQSFLRTIIVTKREVEKFRKFTPEPVKASSDLWFFIGMITAHIFLPQQAEAAAPELPVSEIDTIEFIPDLPRFDFSELGIDDLEP